MIVLDQEIEKSFMPSREGFREEQRRQRVLECFPEDLDASRLPLVPTSGGPYKTPWAAGTV